MEEEEDFYSLEINSFLNMELFGHLYCKKFLGLSIKVMRNYTQSFCFRQHYKTGLAALLFDGKPTSVKGLETLVYLVRYGTKRALLYCLAYHAKFIILTCYSISNS